MEDIFRGQREAAAPVTFTAKVVTTFAPATVCRARGGSVLRGYGNHFRSGTAAAKFCQAGYVVRRLRSLRDKDAGRNLRARQLRVWRVFNGHYLYGLRGTIRYPRRSNHAENIISKPYAETRTFP